MHAFDMQGLLKADPPRRGRREEAKMLDEEDLLLIDRLRCETLQFARQRVGERVSQVDRQGSRADGRPIVKLDLARLACREIGRAHV